MAFIALACACGLLLPIRIFAREGSRGPARDAVPIVVTQVPRSHADRVGGPTHPFLALPGDGSRIVLRQVDGTWRELTAGFHSAADPSVSFDAQRMVFAGKRQAEEPWNIFELVFETGAIRQVTRDCGDCRSPCYQSELHSILEEGVPRHQMTFISDMAGALNEDASGPAFSLYSCQPDGTSVRRLTYNLSDDADPFQMGDGRILYTAWQRASLERGLAGRMALFAVKIDGTDNALFAETAGKRWKRSPCITDGGLVMFLEADELHVDGLGQLGAVTFRRPLQSYRSLTSEADGYGYQWPSPFPGGRLLVSRRPLSGASESLGVVLWDPKTGASQEVLRDPQWNSVQARAIRPLWQPDGRSTVVNEEKPYGKLYCLSVDTHGLPQRDWWPPGTTRRLRVLEGVPLAVTDSPMLLSPDDARAVGVPGSTRNGIPPIVQRRLLGEVNISGDGSFHLTIPANTPIQLQALDADGMALLSCGWIWSKNNEQRGCIGCHEDGELTPDNIYAESLGRPAMELLLPPQRRRTVDFRRDIMPIIDHKCVECHDQGGAEPRLDGGMEPVAFENGVGPFNRAYQNLLAISPTAEPGAFEGLYVQPGRARSSRLIWHLFGRNTSRPWDGELNHQEIKPIPPGAESDLTEQERRAFVEWIDWGAMWDGIPDGNERPDDPAGTAETR